MATQDSPHHHRSAADRMASVVMSTLALLAGLVSLFVSPFFAMSTDACGSTGCRDSLITWAYAVTWGGVALGVVVAVAGMVTAARRGTVMWVWPALALVLVVATFVSGSQLASAVAPGG